MAAADDLRATIAVVCDCAQARLLGVHQRVGQCGVAVDTGELKLLTASHMRSLVPHQRLLLRESIDLIGGGTHASRCVRIRMHVTGVGTA